MVPQVQPMCSWHPKHEKKLRIEKTRLSHQVWSHGGSTFKKKKDIKWPFFPPCRNWPICTKNSGNKACVGGCGVWRNGRPKDRWCEKKLIQKISDTYHHSHHHYQHYQHNPHRNHNLVILLFSSHRLPLAVWHCQDFKRDFPISSGWR